MKLESCLEDQDEIIAIFSAVEEYERDVEVMMVNKEPDKLHNLQVDWNTVCKKPELDNIKDRFKIGDVYECFEYENKMYVIFLIDGLKARHLDALIDKYATESTKIGRVQL